MRLVLASLAEQIIEPRGDAIASHTNAVALRRSRNKLRSVDVVAAAEIGVHEFQPERELACDLDLEAAAHGPAGMHRRSLRDDANRVVADAGLDIAGGEAAFDVGQPGIEAVADAAGHGGKPRELGGPQVGRREIRARKAAVEVGRRRRSFDAKYEPVVLKIIAELPAANHAAAAVTR